MAESDAYVAYIQKFFTRWVGLYDYFSFSIAPSYTAVVEQAGINSGTRVLDVCTGTGEVAIRCAKRGASVVGIDITPAMLEQAKRKAPSDTVSFLEMDARTLAFDDKSFDCAIISFALHDMPKNVRVEVLQEVARVARKVVVLDYEFPRIESIATFYRWFIGLFESPYFKNFVRSDLMEMFSKAGLSMKRSRRIYFGMFSIFESTPE